jgi:chorismate lyase / 3-hydroxybenzoate synthase
VRHVQNFRQVPSASYSNKFGKRPPVFARGSLRHGASWSELIVSGTSSVVGEDTTHDCVCDQSAETVKNLRALLSAKNLGGTGFGLWQLHSVRAYVKRREDLGRVKQEIERHVIAEHIIYLLNDICRPGLLLEVEGIAG